MVEWLCRISENDAKMSLSLYNVINLRLAAGPHKAIEYEKGTPCQTSDVTIYR